MPPARLVAHVLSMTHSSWRFAGEAGWCWELEAGRGGKGVGVDGGGGEVVSVLVVLMSFMMVSVLVAGSLSAACTAITCPTS